MTERLEHFGFSCRLPEPDIIGDCAACGGAVYRDEEIYCETCGKPIHEGCQVTCFCGHDGCRGCMLYDADNDMWFCDTADNGELEASECRNDFLPNK